VFNLISFNLRHYSILRIGKIEMPSWRLGHYERNGIGTEHVETCYQQDLPKPDPEHDWLQQFVGKWETDMECCMEPGKPPMKSKGAESVRPIGGFWIIAEGEGTVPV
jgi:hypothetical protein